MTTYRLQFPLLRTELAFDGGVTTLHWQAGPSQNDLDANAFHLAARGFLQRLCVDMNNSYRWRVPLEYTVPSEGDTAFPFEPANVLDIVGEDSGPDLPHQTQGVITWRTDLRNRSGIGRTFVPGPCTTHLDQFGGIGATYRANVKAAIDFYLADNAGGDDVGPCIFSKKLGTSQRIRVGALSQQWSVLRSRRM